MFKDKVVVVTGGVKGIGKCICEEFEKAGAKVCVIDILDNPYFVGDIAKEEVLQEICSELLRYILDYMTEHRFYENTRLWLIDFFRNIAENQVAYKLVVNAQVPKNIVLEFDEGRILKKLQRNDSPLEQYRALVIAKGITESVVVWVRNGMKETPEEMAEIMLEIFSLNDKRE